MALKAISRDKPDLLEALRNRLREVRKHSRAEYDIDTRVKDTACLREILERIEDAADDKV